MVVNDVPGEECRIALIEHGRLEELYAERTASVTNVSNIYKGRVVNIEPAIQAAFVDFGSGQNGFLHISDLHPMYFPSGDKTERVGKKIPRRERPPIQDALKRGDDILVQVIKEGIGTKGPTLTSYLSIPGRLMVMMPNMDKVGVSRRIEDEDKRREMRKVLDALDLPDGMGFILRTAGFGRTKTELKRDLAFLTRLWKQMEKRIESAKAPCPLYVESDVLIRTIRDVLSSNITRVVVDSQSAYDRATEFLRVIAPRSAPKVLRFTRPTPIFHAFDIERQIEQIHQREVPLPSGGAIVIEQTEALVAIDVNSGRSRSARDSETNAYQTNVEAVDEICRHLRLRDLGGLVVCDLIDMNRADNRRKIEQRFRDNLARDRARTTITHISEFGILEMTRQRMRPGMRKTHYQPCPHCEGHGEVRTADSIAGDALRHAAHLLHHDRIRTVEIVCAARVASAFLGSKRREIVRIEDAFDKRIRVRVSDTIPVSRIDYYAYDDRNADVDISKLPAVTPPTLEELEREFESSVVDDGDDANASASKRSRRRRRRGKAATLVATLRSDDFASELDDIEREERDEQKQAADDEAATASPEKKKRRRRRRKKGQEPETATDTSTTQSASESADTAEASAGSSADTDEQPKKKRRRRRRKKSDSAQDAEQPKAEADASADTDSSPEAAVASDDDASPPKKKRRRRRKKAGQPAETAATGDQAKESADADVPAPEASPAATDGDEEGAAPKKKRRRRSRKRATAQGDDAATPDSAANGEPASGTSGTSGSAKKSPAAKPRSLYRSRRKVSAEKARAARDVER